MQLLSRTYFHSCSGRRVEKNVLAFPVDNHRYLSSLLRATGPKQKPASLLADKGYDSGPLRGILRWLGIRPRIPRRGEGERGLGRLRWVVERTLSWFHQFRRLRIRWDRRPDVHQAFLDLAAAVICYRMWRGET